MARLYVIFTTIFSTMYLRSTIKEMSLRKKSIKSCCSEFCTYTAKVANSTWNKTWNTIINEYTLPFLEFCINILDTVHAQVINNELTGYVIKYVLLGYLAYDQVKTVYISSRARLKEKRSELEDIELQIRIISMKLNFRYAAVAGKSQEIRQAVDKQKKITSFLRKITIENTLNQNNSVDNHEDYLRALLATEVKQGLANILQTYPLLENVNKRNVNNTSPNPYSENFTNHEYANDMILPGVIKKSINEHKTPTVAHKIDDDNDKFDKNKIVNDNISTGYNFSTSKVHGNQVSPYKDNFNDIPAMTQVSKISNLSKDTYVISSNSERYIPSQNLLPPKSMVQDWIHVLDKTSEINQGDDRANIGQPVNFTQELAEDRGASIGKYISKESVKLIRDVHNIEKYPHISSTSNLPQDSTLNDNLTVSSKEISHIASSSFAIVSHETRLNSENAPVHISKKGLTKSSRNLTLSKKETQQKIHSIISSINIISKFTEMENVRSYINKPITNIALAKCDFSPFSPTFTKRCVMELLSTAIDNTQECVQISSISFSNVSNSSKCDETNSFDSNYTILNINKNETALYADSCKYMPTTKQISDIDNLTKDTYQISTASLNIPSMSTIRECSSGEDVSRSIDKLAEEQQNPSIITLVSKSSITASNTDRTCEPNDQLNDNTKNLDVKVSITTQDSGACSRECLESGATNAMLKSNCTSRLLHECNRTVCKINVSQTTEEYCFKQVQTAALSSDARGAPGFVHSQEDSNMFHCCFRMKGCFRHTYSLLLCSHSVTINSSVAALHRR